MARKRGKKNAGRDALILLALVAAILPLSIAASAHMEVEDAETLTSLQALRAAPSDSVSLSFGGDVIMGRYVPAAAERTGESLLGSAGPIFAASDLSVANLETPILLVADPADRPEKNIYFDARPGMLDYIADLDVLLLSNNHTADYGRGGVAETIQNVSDYGFTQVGAGATATDAYRPVYIEEGGLRFAYLGFTDVLGPESVATDDEYGVATSNLDRLLPAVRQADKQADFVIVAAHWGVEYRTDPTKRQEVLAEALAAAGADLVVGSHPHVLQRAEMIGSTLVFYSLGNLVSDQGWSDTRETVVPTLIIDPATLHAQLYIEPFRIKEGRPTAFDSAIGYRSRAAFAKITRRSNIDFHQDGTALVADVFFAD